ncbi:hypothetical protein GGR92_004196 [Spirosoma lacussanchae]
MQVNSGGLRQGFLLPIIKDTPAGLLYENVVHENHNLLSWGFGILFTSAYVTDALQLLCPAVKNQSTLEFE